MILYIIVINITINTLWITSLFEHVLELVLFLTYIYYILYFLHILLVSVSYSSRGFLIFFSLFPYCFLKNVLLISHSLYIHIVVNIVLYLYILL